ncbi:MAG: hypothetical protein HKN12_00245, partial [Gemmatimonadetes bacterium]|nr:hypothetical protein [Gemmatimonadota bacterium]
MTSGPDSLPEDITEVTLTRIVLLCLTPPALVVLGNLVNIVNSFVLGITTFDYSPLEAAHDVVITVLSLAAAWTVHRRRFSPRILIRVGLAYCVFAALWFSATECLVVGSYHSDPIRLGMSYFSFTMVWVVFFPAIVPMRSAAAVTTIVLAASTAPLMRWGAESLGWVQFSEGSVVFVTIAMIFSVIMGVAVSNVVYQLGRSVTEAREMGSYRLEKNLGSGGMGEVWSASHR